jgi:hypothetical protein
MSTYKIELRRDVAADWTSNNPTLALGEVGLETDTKRWKVGDGSTPWTSLTYFDGNITATKLDDLTAPDANTDLNASTTKHGLLVAATAPAANLLNVVGIANGETAYTNKAIFDATNPAALGTAGPGTSLTAAHRDHVHTLPKLDDAAAPDDNTDVNASVTAHGLCPKLGTTNSPGSMVSSGTLTAGNANAIAFGWHNPLAVDIFITKVVVEVTTPGGTGGSLLRVGISDDTNGTNIGEEFFPATGLTLNTAAVYDSWNSDDTGAQVKFITCQDSASATDGWICGKILTQNAASLAGKYYIYYSVK